jgi:hypothetical protein
LLVGALLLSAILTAAARVFPSMERDDVKQMLRAGGCRVVEAPPVGPVKPGVLKRLIQIDQPFPFTIELKGESDTKPDTYEAMRLITYWNMGARSATRTGCSQRSARRADLRPDGDVMVIYDAPVAGASMRWFLLVPSVWGYAWRTANRPCSNFSERRRTTGPARAADGENDPTSCRRRGRRGAGGKPRQSRPARTVVH